MKNDYIHFIKKLLLYGSPLLVLSILYLLMDPFMVIRSYPDYTAEKGVTKNLNYTAVEMYKKNYDKFHYNSFIFGSSRSQAFKAESWKKYIDGSPFHFSAWSESAGGIFSKIKYIDSAGRPLKNCMIMFDASVFENLSASKGGIMMPHPDLTGQSIFDFQTEYFKAWFSDFFWAQYIGYHLTHKRLPGICSGIDNRSAGYSVEYNDIYYTFYDKEIKKDSLKYYSNKEFSRRNGSVRYTNPSIDTAGLRLLHNIKAVFDKQGTNYKIIINPLFDQKIFCREDLKKLQDIFGTDHVYDFSGRNNYTDNISNYYETSHYKPNVAEDIMKNIYKR